MKIYIVVLINILLFGCMTNKNEAPDENGDHSFYVGTYTLFLGTTTKIGSRGIYKYLLEKDGSLKRIALAAISQNPSFLTMTADKKFLLAVNEKGEGAVESFLISDDSLVVVSRSSSGGADPCFIVANEAGYILAANYTGGNVGLLRVNEKGILTNLLDVQTHTGSSTHQNQQGPHAHSAWFEPVNNNIISVDLGTNELWFSRLDTAQQKLVPSKPHKLAMKPGAGPRHLVFHPNGRWIYVVNELDCTITFINKSDSGAYEKGASISTLPADFTDDNSCADIRISSDGKFVYASNRGHNSIVIYEVNATDGSLNLIGHEPTRGKTPRNFSLSPGDKYIVVANQETNNIVSFERDKTNGLLRYADQIETPTPVCILF